jgi:FAD/FMN-containing dehydrogenase
MNAPAVPITLVRTSAVRTSADHSALAARLRREVRGDVLFDAASRGRYATDASIYQIEPVGVVVPQTEEDALVALQIAREQGVPVLPRGAGTSQCGQTVGAALVIDASKHLNRMINIDTVARTAEVEPGIVLDHLNAQLRPRGLWFPVDVSTSAQAELSGRRVHRGAGHVGRHGRQQLLRLALHPLREHGAQRVGGGCVAQ